MRDSHFRFATGAKRSWSSNKNNDLESKRHRQTIEFHIQVSRFVLPINIQITLTPFVKKNPQRLLSSIKRRTGLQNESFIKLTLLTLEKVSAKRDRLPL